VIGNEAVGISKPLRKFGTPVTLPQKTADVSYNASVAAGILLFMIGTKHKLI
jgi:tRNA G18 (ribose-2'-O)-methylase SpoU